MFRTRLIIFHRHGDCRGKFPVTTVREPLQLAGPVRGSDMRTRCWEAWTFALSSAPHYPSYLGKSYSPFGASVFLSET